MTASYEIRHNPGSINGDYEIVALVGPHAGKVVNGRSTQAEAEKLVNYLENTYDARSGKKLRTASAEAWRIGARHGVNGQVWDNA
jgi:hypothetical protein